MQQEFADDARLTLRARNLLNWPQRTPMGSGTM
jgi:hypothetical protein